MNKSILLVGVGGQGTILASKLLTSGLMEAGYDVKMSEIHGMSQRGGSVSSQVRYGDNIYSPVIELGGADILVSFEKMETLRWLKYLKTDGKIIYSDYKIEPIPVLNGSLDYKEEDIDKELGRFKAIKLNIYDTAMKVGSIKTMNIILLGTLIKSMELENINWEYIIKNNVKNEFVDINIIAFYEGMNLIDKKSENDGL